MELREGYKQTEVGDIPKDWEVFTIEQLIAQGIIEKPLDGNHGNIHPKTSDFVDTGIPFIMANNVQEGQVDLKNCHFIKKEQADKLQKGFSITDDVLITHKGTVGNVAIVGKLFSEYIMLTPQVTYYRVKDKNRIICNYIKHYFESSKFQSILTNVAGGGTRAYIGITGQQKLIFVLPPYTEQTVISTVLSDADALIQSLEKLIGKKRAIKQGAMQEFLSGKRRLLGFGNKTIKYKMTEIGIIPDDWEVMKLSEITSLMTNGFVGTVKSHYCEYDNGILYIQGYNVEENTFNFRGIKRVTKEFHKQHSKSCLREGDLLTVQTGDVGLTTIVPKELEDSNCHALIITRFKKERANPHFFSLYLNSFQGRTRLKEIEIGTTMKHINVGDMIFFLVPVPPMREQTAIADVLSNMDAEITALESKLTKYKQIKQGMMQNLLTGRIRLI